MKLISKYQNIKNIIFDLGGVLLDIDIKSSLDAFDRLNIGGISANDIARDNVGVFLQLEVGAITAEEFFDGLRSISSKAGLTDEELLAAWNAILIGFDMRKFEILEKLRPHYNIYLLSNTNAPHREKYLEMFREQSGGREFESYFDKCFYSDEMKLRKPDAEIYRQVISQTAINPAESLFLDDNAVNFPGAVEVGLNIAEIRPDFTIFDIVEPLR